MAKRNDSPNSPLNSAKRAKNDEFYTQFSDIAEELRHYREHFRGKTIFCNCDDPYESNFFKYFALNFNFFGLKKLIATCYAGSPIANTELSLFDHETPENKTTRNPHKIEISEVPHNPEKGFDLTDVAYLLRNEKNVLTRLKGDGDFRSSECIELLKQADIVVTNPPLSLFREYVAQLVEFDKKFLIVGNSNAVTYKGIFTLIKENKKWIGSKPMGKDMWFDVPENFAKELTTNKQEGSAYKIVDGVIKGRSQAIWFTNLDIKKRHEEFKLYKTYNAKEYPTYDNYDAIEVPKVAEIPVDYDGVMGVPISFLDKYNPKQFEILGCNRGIDQDPNGVYGRGAFLNGKEVFKRLFVRRIKKIKEKLSKPQSACWTLLLFPPQSARITNRNHFLNFRSPTQCRLQKTQQKTPICTPQKEKKMMSSTRN